MPVERHMSRGGPCMCGATDCPRCGPAQGYEVRRVYINGRVRFVNPEDDEDHADEDEHEPEGEEA